VVGRAINSVDAVNVVKAERIAVLLLLDWVFQKSLSFASSSLLFMIGSDWYFLVTAPYHFDPKNSTHVGMQKRCLFLLLRVLHGPSLPPTARSSYFVTKQEKSCDGSRI